MASPFKTFRKNQKAWMVFLTIMTVFSFTFLGIVSEFFSFRSRSEKDKVVAATTKFGDLRESNLSFLRADRLKVLGVMTALMEQAGVPAQRARQYLELEKFGPATEDSLVNSWLLAHHAQRAGMVVSDDAINNFLETETLGRVSSEKMREVIEHAGLSTGQFFLLLRHELLALKAQELFRPSLLASTPAQRWDYFNRINRYATIEAVAVPAADYLGKVLSPTDEDLKTFFEENKERIATPDSPEPGFRQPQRVALAYVQADLQKFADPKIITDQQVQEKYEKEKERYQPDSYEELQKKLHPEKPAPEAGQKPTEPPKKGPAAQPKKAAEPPKPLAAPKATPKKPAPDKNSTSGSERPATAVAGGDRRSAAPAIAVAGRLQEIDVEKIAAGEPLVQLTALAEEKKENKKDSAGESEKPRPVVAEGGEKKADTKAPPPAPAKAETPGLKLTPPASAAKPPPQGKRRRAGKGPARGRKGPGETGRDEAPTAQDRPDRRGERTHPAGNCRRETSSRSSTS